MAIKAYFSAAPNRWPQYEGPLQSAFEAAGLDVALSPHCNNPEATDYVIYAPNGPALDFRLFTKTKAVLSLWAGVERIVRDAALTQPLCRMVDDGLKDGMVDYVVGHVLRYHLGMDRYIVGGTGWDPIVPPLARHRRVTILGLGELGIACGKTLSTHGFSVSGWSRRLRDVPGVSCFAGADGLREALSRAEILVLLLPLTPETDGVIDRNHLKMLLKGANLINPGRGGLIEDEALLEALEAGQVGHATLDVFRKEPLPLDHPYWSHPRVTVTPHIASETRPETAAQVIAENIRRGEAGEPFLHLVDRSAGY